MQLDFLTNLGGLGVRPPGLPGPAVRGFTRASRSLVGGPCYAPVYAQTLQAAHKDRHISWPHFADIKDAGPQERGALAS